MNFNLAVILSETAAATPDQNVAVYDGGALTYRELDERSGRLAAGLLEAGTGLGDLVALQLPNIAEFLVAYFGILKAGAIAVPLNVLLKAPEVEYSLKDSGARILITWAAVLEDAARGASGAGTAAVYAVGCAPDDPRARPFERLWRRARPRSPRGS